jgi:hypothetical protein
MPALRDPLHESDAPALQSRAMDNLRYIRRTMEEAGAFTAVPGWGIVAVGASAVLAAALAARQTTSTAWLAVWCAEAALAIAIAMASMARKAARGRVPLFGGPARRFWLSFVAPLFAGALLTAALFGSGETRLLAPTWLLLYGAAVITGGVSSVRIVPVMGAGFVAAGALALLLPGVHRDVWLAAGFGVLHLVFGFVIARRHGG